MLVISACILLPLLILWLTYKIPVLNKVGGIIIAYIFGCALGLTGIIPDDEATHALQTNVATAAIPFAIPLLLFSADIKSWTRLAKPFIISTIAALIACALSVFVGFEIYGNGDNAETYSSVGGMLTGLYTGGNANLASLKIALGVDDATYLLVSAYSTVASAIYLFIVIIVGKKILRAVLPDFKDDKDKESLDIKIENHDNELFYGLFRRDNLKDLGKALLLTVIIIALGAGIAKGFAVLVSADAFQSVFILSISLLAIIASTNKKVRAIKRTFELGTLFIIIFSVAVASQVSLKVLSEVDTNIFVFTTIVTFGTLILHILLNAIMRVDTDTTLTTSISLICSPPFAPVMGSVLHNKAVIGPGIAVGLFGYAIGTYFGFGLAKLLLYI
ncbi:MAG: DUF819 family protein [Bacteroidales bacterium]|nr:DUF819 family protein [Bacteroidales bacterium]